MVDGTYLYTEKSDSFYVQRATYSSQKHRNLLKELVFVMADGTFFDSFGPCYADGHHNDPSLLEDVMDKDLNQIKSVFSDTDSIIGDKAFSRAKIPYAVITPKAPANRADKRLTAGDANESPFVTFVRHVPENSFGPQEKWNLFSNTISAKYCAVIHDLWRFSLAISNKFFTPIVTDNIVRDNDLISLEDRDLLMKMKILWRLLYPNTHGVGLVLMGYKTSWRFSQLIWI
jgi:hypothetical protein